MKNLHSVTACRVTGKNSKILTPQVHGVNTLLGNLKKVE